MNFSKTVTIFFLLVALGLGVCFFATKTCSLSVPVPVEGQGHVNVHELIFECVHVWPVRYIGGWCKKYKNFILAAINFFPPKCINFQGNPHP
jgi:hypothetical protein